MNSLHRHNVRLAPWIGFATPLPEQAAFLEHALDHARSWLKYGERRWHLSVDVKTAPMLLHPKQTA